MWVFEGFFLGGGTFFCEAQIENSILGQVVLSIFVKSYGICVSCVHHIHEKKNQHVGTLSFFPPHKTLRKDEQKKMKDTSNKRQYVPPVCCVLKPFRPGSH